MDGLFLIIFMLSSLAIVIFALLAIIQFVKKNRVKGKKQLKLTGITFIATFISIIGFGVTMDSTEGKEVAEKTEEKSEKNAASEAKEEDKITTSTEENDAEKQTEADKTKEIASYNNEFSPAIDSVQKEYAAFGMIYGQQLLIAYQKETLMFIQHININVCGN